MALQVEPSFFGRHFFDSTIGQMVNATRRYFALCGGYFRGLKISLALVLCLMFLLRLMEIKARDCKFSIINTF